MTVRVNRPMSAYGNTILKTPNMDQIAAGGVRFTEAFVTNALCAEPRVHPHRSLLARPRRDHERRRAGVLQSARLAR